ncbi:MAG TPA: SUMF1/EgtB/PvdO family nonheme iron enzyme [Candidatus Acidoferrales bacterium]|nr:SUMF1/EgtB/PvdO family nonheme iron enzyme [Candidatus Acidoferrales bacterium]
MDLSSLDYFSRFVIPCSRAALIREVVSNDYPNQTNRSCDIISSLQFSEARGRWSMRGFSVKKALCMPHRLPRLLAGNKVGCVKLFSIAAVIGLALGWAPYSRAQSISSVIFKGSPASPTVLINGQGFTPQPAATSIANAGHTGNDYGTSLYIADSTGSTQFHAGYEGPSEHDSIGLVISTYNDSLVSYTLGSSYGSYYYPNHIFQLNEGDSFTVYVRNGTFSGSVHYRVDSETSSVPADRSQISTLVNPTDGQRYVWIPPGAFMMGCSPGDTECEGNEKPAHEERIAAGFWLGETEVTQVAYQRVTGANPSTHRGDQLPVETITWNHAVNYCTAIGGRLPTEVEWEYAARAGAKWARYGSLDEVAWYRGNSGDTNQPVARKQPNAFGLYDMLGNVWEWTKDSYGDTGLKVVRGGARSADSRGARASYRVMIQPSLRNDDKGFRCAGDWPGTEKTAPTVSANPVPAVNPSGAGDGPHPRAQSQATDVLSKVRQTYTHLDAIHVVAKLSESTILPSRTVSTEVEYEFASKLPGRFRARSKSNTLEALSVSDGSNTWKALPKAKQWMKLDVGALGEAGEEDRGVKTPQDFPHSISSILVSRYPAIAKQGQASEILREDTYSVSGRKIGCYVVRTRIKETEYEFWIDKERYLVLRDEETGAQRFGTGKYKVDLKVSEIETGSGVEESLFTFQPDRKWAETETIVLPNEKPPMLVGRPAPDFTLKSLDGGQVRLSSLRGKVVVLDFWATWCAPCRAELPTLEKLRTEFGADVQFLGINDEEAGTTRGFRKSQGYEMTVLMDNKREVNHQYGVQGIPTLLVIDSNGMVRQHWVGGRGERELRSAIQAASKL